MSSANTIATMKKEFLALIKKHAPLRIVESDEHTFDVATYTPADAARVIRGHYSGVLKGTAGVERRATFECAHLMGALLRDPALRDASMRVRSEFVFAADEAHGKESALRMLLGLYYVFQNAKMRHFLYTYMDHITSGMLYRIMGLKLVKNAEDFDALANLLYKKAGVVARENAVAVAPAAPAPPAPPAPAPPAEPQPEPRKRKRFEDDVVTLVTECVAVAKKLQKLV